MNLLRLGAILGFLSVALGAFGTHSLRGKLSEEMIKVWQTGTQYQLVHAVMICICGWLAVSVQSKRIGIAGWLFVAGSVIFSGSLYALSLSGVTVLGAVTPLGGLFMLAGWILLAVAASDLKPRPA